MSENTAAAELVTTAPEIQSSLPQLSQLPIVAISRDDFPRAQSHLRAVIESRLAEHRDAVADLEANVAIAKRNKWRQSGTQRALSLSRRLVVYYEKALEAVEAGFMLMPNLNCDVFAVRVREGSAPRGMTTSYNNWDPAFPSAEAPGLPLGEGEYVSDQTTGDRRIEKWKDAQQQERQSRHAIARDYLPPESPLVLARPRLLEAAETAMSLRLFDEIGVVGANRSQRRADPMLVGRIRDPRPNRVGMSFFLAWWVDPRTL